MKKITITRTIKTAPRDPHVQHMLRRKVGAHGKSGKALRHTEKMAFRKKMRSGRFGDDGDFAKA